ncbi:hypothetical protein F4776DRAFT_156369 [Hypoxylon sp. NC0597]|nr:hypothetical protein F4776DRAFT_156369 [Hypoxylon sp. NC0597]
MMDSNIDDNPLLNVGVPGRLKSGIHPLSAVDQSAPRQYIRWMFIFDFPDASGPASLSACTSINKGLDYVFDQYPFLTGRLGPLYHPAKKNLIQLRYSRTARPDILHWTYHETTSGYDYPELCKAGMPVSHWSIPKFCAAPSFYEKSEWLPAFTLQATFLKSGALVLCFAFHNSVVDQWSIPPILARFAMGTRHPKPILKSVEYRPPDISEYVDHNTTEKFNKFPEWTPWFGLLSLGQNTAIRGQRKGE